MVFSTWTLRDCWVQIWGIGLLKRDVVRFLPFGTRWACTMPGTSLDRGGVVVYDGANFWGFKWRHGSRWGVGTFSTACSVDLGGRPFVTFPIFMPTDKRAPWEMSCDGGTNMQVVKTNDFMFFLFQKSCNEDSSTYLLNKIMNKVKDMAEVYFSQILWWQRLSF